MLAARASLAAQSGGSGPPPGDAGWMAPAREKARTAPMHPTPEGIERGRALYVRHCATCHGDAGRGDGPLARLHAQRTSRPPYDLTDPAVQSALPDGEIFWKVSTGYREGSRVVMPAFAAQVPSEEDRWRIVQFVRTLVKPR
jgi:mono/diheme cytochrome c family protein